MVNGLDQVSVGLCTYLVYILCALHYEREIAYQVLPREEYQAQKQKKQIKGSGPRLCQKSRKSKRAEMVIPYQF